MGHSFLAVWEAGGTVYELVAPALYESYDMQTIWLGKPGDWGLSGKEEELDNLLETGKITYRTVFMSWKKT